MSSWFKKQWGYIFCGGRAKSEYVPSTPGVAVVENQGLLHAEEWHRLLQKLGGRDTVMEVLFEWWLQFLHLAETLPFYDVEFTSASKKQWKWNNYFMIYYVIAQLNALFWLVIWFILYNRAYTIFLHLHCLREIVSWMLYNKCNYK